MLKTILDFIEVILKKYGMITLVSFVMGIVSVTVLSDDIVNILPFGKQNIYWAFVTAIIVWIIVLSFVKSSFEKIFYRILSNISHNKCLERKENEAKQKIHEMIDKFCPEDRERVYGFVKNGNKPITFNESLRSYGYHGLMDTKWLDIAELRSEHEESFIDGNTGEKHMYKVYDTHVAKLKPDLYKYLCRLYKEDGRLGNF